MDSCDNTPKVPFDPGWNDPPKLAYNTQQTTPNRPRNFLNKRVAFPLSGGSNSAPPPAINLPPMPALLPTQIPIASNENTDELASEADFNIDSESALIEVKGILMKFLEESSELGPKATDINRRISVMEEMWSSGKLNKQVQMHMKELAGALKHNQPSKADEVHRALMVDHVSAVGTWMPGIKQLIHHCIARSELLAIDKE